MKSKYAYLLLPLLIAAASACGEHELDKFEDTPSLYFFNGPSNSHGSAQVDSTNYSFFLAGSRTSDTVWLDVRLTGDLSDRARPIPIAQADGDVVNAAVAGRDYVPFDDPRQLPLMVMPAGATSAAIPIVVLRTAQMDIDEFRLDLAITSNEHFSEGIEGEQSFTLKITAMASQPAQWNKADTNGYYRAFGDWGQEKMRFIIDHTGYTAFDEALDNVDMQRFLNMKVRKALADYLLENPPLSDGGVEVTFPQL